MTKKLQLWWRQKRRPLEMIVIFLSLMTLFALILVIITGYLLHWAWTGLSQRTLWDWLQLLIIPAVLAVGGYLFNFTSSRTERDIAISNQHEGLLQAYIDKMSELLLEKHLRESKKEDEVRILARVRTLTVLSRLDKDRKRSILQFLYEAGLIKNSSLSVDLSGADLSGVDLSNDNLSVTNLSGANLSLANLSGANLSLADLSRVDLSNADLKHAMLLNANLSDANLSDANLNRANLSGANLSAIPNVSAHGGTRSSVTLLVRANLSQANLISANLSQADLTSANLSDAYLGGVNLSGANLIQATISQKQLDRAETLSKTTMPDGSQHS